VIAALDLGGTKLAAALVQRGQLSQRRQIPTPPDRRPEAMLESMLELLQPLLPGARALGVAATGTVDQGKVSAPNPQTLPWVEVDLGRLLSQRTGLPVFVLNDADAAAWGEARHGAGRGVPNFVFVTVSTGIGSGLVLDGTLREGAELGFTRVADGRFLEHVASGTALDVWAQERGWKGAAEVVERSQTDLEAAARLDQSAGFLAEKLGDLRAVLRLERVILGGGLGLAEGYRARVQKQVDPALAVVAAQLGADAGLVGAADWAERRLDADFGETGVG
jgi:predicted NBD/HSP70 family sugar kinase